MCMEKTLWEQAVEFHGHECIGLAAGYRIAEAAVNALQNGCDCGCGGDSTEKMVAVVENVSCSVDAVQFITGCTLGKRNLLIQNIGPGFIFSLPDKNKAVRVTLKENWKARREEIMAHKKTEEEEKELLAAKMKSVIAEILSEPLEDVCRVEEVDYTVYHMNKIQKKGGKYMHGHRHKGHAHRHGTEVCTCGCGCMEVCTCGCGCTDVCACGCGCTDVCTCGCGCETRVPFSFQRLFYSRQEKIERLKDYLKNLEAEAKEVERRLKRLEEDDQ